MSSAARTKIQTKNETTESMFRLFAGCPTARVPGRATVYDQGDKAQAIYLVRSGQIKTVSVTANGRECLLAIHQRGEIFGESCLASGSYRYESAIAVKESILSRIFAPELLARLGEDYLRGDFLAHLADRLARQQRLIVGLAADETEQRLAEALLRLAQTAGNQDEAPPGVTISISQDDLAHMIGASRPHLNLLLSHLRAMDLIKAGRRRCRLTVVSIERLREHLSHHSR